MRYLNWDVLLFPANSNLPIQEFKTACHVVQEQDFANQHNSVILLPTVTAFVPALNPGDAFRISIHSWATPQLSRCVQSFGKHPDLVMFEAQVFIDGNLAGTKSFRRDGPWPTIITSSLEVDRNGDISDLLFPTFHREILAQNYWSAGDELGRIKVIIHEGFARDSMGISFDKVKSIVAFSFQHAPLEMLEAFSIAWPNASMWHQTSNLQQYIAQASPPRNVAVDPSAIELHSHSPRGKCSLDNVLTTTQPQGAQASSISTLPRLSGSVDPLMDSGFSGHRQLLSTDISMPDYSSTVSQATNSWKVTDKIGAYRSELGLETLQSVGAYDTVCAALVPSSLGKDSCDEVDIETMGLDQAGEQRLGHYSDAVENKETNPGPVIPPSAFVGGKFREQNELQSADGYDTHKAASKFAECTRKVTQLVSCTTHGSGGSKRQRVVTPAAFKVIDETDEPRSSPMTRKVPQIVARSRSEGKGVVLGDIQTNRV